MRQQSRIQNRRSKSAIPMLSSILLHPGVSIPPAALALVWIAWYWVRLGRADVPVSRRKIRRTSLVLMAISLPIFVRALSFLDPKTDPVDFMRTWLLALLMIIIVLASAGIDALNNLRLHQAIAHEEIRRAARQLAQALERRRLVELGQSATPRSSSDDDQELSA